MNKNNAIQIGQYSYLPHKLVGQGSFATVYQGYNNVTDAPVAVKKIRINEMNNRMNKLWSEIKIMKSLNHLNIVKLYDVHLDISEEVMYLFLEWCDGDLTHMFRKDPSPKDPNEKTVRDLFIQIREGMKYLIENSIIHRDLKPQNILLNNEGVIKICDFGLSTLADQNSLLNTMCGSPMYMAPEVIAHETYTNKSDLWSLGVILYELLYRKHPYPVTNYHQLVQQIKKRIEYPVDVSLSDNVLNLLYRLLQYDCFKRIEWHEFFQHNWFSCDLNNHELRSGGQFTLPDIDLSTDEIFLTCDTSGSEYDISQVEGSIEINSHDELFRGNKQNRSPSSLPITIKKDFNLSQYTVNDYHNASSVPVGSSGFRPVSFSPKINSNSVGSQVFRYLSKNSSNYLKKLR